MSLYFNVTAKFTAYGSRMNKEHQLPSDGDSLRLSEMAISDSEEGEDLGAPLHGTAVFECDLSDGPADWRDKISSVITSLAEEIEVEDYTVSVSPEMAEEAAQLVRDRVNDMAAALHGDWQDAERERRQVRRKPVKDDAWIERALAEAELDPFTLSEDQLSQFANGKTDFLDELAVDLGPGQGLELLTPDGERAGVIVDILSTDYEELPSNWQEDNRNAAEGAAELVAAAIEESGSFSIEAIAEKIHEQWLEANPWAADGDQGKDYKDLSEEDQDRDRTVAWAVLSCLDE